MRDFCICVPARNEAERLPILLDSFAAQTVPGAIRVAICVNNSDDGTAELARQAARAYPGRLLVTVDERRFPPAEAHAGSARRAAMDLGVSILSRDDAILISTDADCRPPEQWIAAILVSIEDDLVVGGKILLDDADAIAPTIAALRARFDRYWERVRAIEDEIDPRAWDPAPRHGDHTGASLALTVGLYRRAGGVPLVATGEDVALVHAAIGAGGLLVHPSAVWTRTSARTVGRADGGMAQDMARLSASAASGGLPMVPAFDHWRDRARWRRANRDGAEAALVSLEKSMASLPCDMPLPEAR